MKRFKNILVIPSELSADDPGLQRAIRLAENNAARLTVLWPLEEASDGGTGLEYFPEVAPAIEDALEKAVEPAREQGLSVRTLVRTGRPFIEIIRQVQTAGHDLVMKTARGKKLHKSMIFGTTALHLLRKCPCQVWIVDPNPERHSGVLAAVDPDTTREEGHAMNRTIMELATSLSILEDMDLHVVHAWSAAHEDMIKHSPFLRISKSEADRYVKDTETRHRERFEGLIEQFRRKAPHVKTHFIKGLPEIVIPEVVRENQIEVVVMGTLARTGIPGLLIGNTAEGVLNQVDCSVLAIKPEGFVSPIAA
jgi:nucleotide-binding universal stress UspA family protein